MDKLKWVWISGVSLVFAAGLAISMRMGIRPESKKWYGILFASDYFPPLNGFPTTSDADERIIICEKLGEAYPFKNSSRYPLDKNYYCASGSQYTKVIVYEIIDPVEQQKIIKAAKNIRILYNTRSFLIEFYAKQTGESPTDQFIRKVRID